MEFGKRARKMAKAAARRVKKKARRDEFEPQPSSVEPHAERGDTAAGTPHSPYTFLVTPESLLAEHQSAATPSRSAKRKRDTPQTQPKRAYRSLEGAPEDLPEELYKYWYARHDLFSRFDEGVMLDHGTERISPF